MLILGIESSCDETAASVVEDGRIVRSNVVASQAAEHNLYGGVVPEIASRRHIEAISGVAASALAEAGVCAGDLEAVAVTFAPGLIGGVLVGVNFAKGLALAANKPLVPVHHLRGHIAALYLTHPQLEPPFLCLVASGGHSHIIQVLDYTRFRVLGRTVDDAAGEAFDKVARTLGLGYPGGPAVARAAEGGDPRAYRLPTPKLAGRYDVSFSGLKTAVLNLVNQAGMKGETVSVPDMAASFQFRATEILAEKLMLAARETGAEKVCIAGRRGGKHGAAQPAGAGLRGPGCGAVPAPSLAVRGQRRHDRCRGLLRVSGRQQGGLQPERPGDAAYRLLIVKK